MELGRFIFDIQNHLDKEMYNALEESNKESAECTVRIYDLQKLKLHSMQCESVPSLEELKVEYVNIWEKVKDSLPSYEKDMQPVTLDNNNMENSIKDLELQIDYLEEILKNEKFKKSNIIDSEYREYTTKVQALLGALKSEITAIKHIINNCSSIGK